MHDDLSNSRILIVDDTKTNIDILVSALGKKYKLSVARDGNSALLQAKENPPDLILLDVMMPIMDWFRGMYKIKSR